MADKQCQDFKSFYPFYLSQHQNATCRRLHYLGSGLIVLLLLVTLVSQQWWQLLFIPVIGYGFAWIGHFVFEKNKPATFEYPLYSLLADWVMFAQMLKKLFLSKS
ncbi:Mpo1-like protein [Shewanella sp. 10N.286.51.B2]|uniref:Mpo1-like protein n=1 Tax=Shewanella sp. 10N.286.51.B2 TaxID=3229707 RepID=UPI00354CDDB9